MSEYLQIHPETPQRRLVATAADILRKGGAIAYPTDSSYALGCMMGEKASMERIRRIREAGRDHHFTLVCRDLAQIAVYAGMDNRAHRLIRSLTPGPYTFLLRATGEVPKRLQNPRRKTIGVRIPDHPVPIMLVEELGEPIMSSTLHMPGDDLPIADGYEARERLDHLVDAIIDSGNCGIEPTTVIDLVSGLPVIVRKGRGDVSGIE